MLTVPEEPRTRPRARTRSERRIRLWNMTPSLRPGSYPARDGPAAPVRRLSSCHSLRQVVTQTHIDVASAKAGNRFLLCMLTFYPPKMQNCRHGKPKSRRSPSDSSLRRALLCTSTLRPSEPSSRPFPASRFGTSSPVLAAAEGSPPFSLTSTCPTSRPAQISARPLKRVALARLPSRRPSSSVRSRSPKPKASSFPTLRLHGSASATFSPSRQSFGLKPSPPWLASAISPWPRAFSPQPGRARRKIPSAVAISPAWQRRFSKAWAPALEGAGSRLRPPVSSAKPSAARGASISPRTSLKRPPMGCGTCL